jgi:ABC-type multidrug transport system fused ATPase/permease subunit
MLWQASRQPGTLAGGMVFGIAWMLCQVAWPYLLGRAVDAGLAHGLAGAAPWCAALLAAAGVQAATTPLRHCMAVVNRLRSSLGIARLVGYHSAQTGRAIITTTTPGEIVSTVANDALRLGEVFDVSARLSGSAVAYLAVVVLMFRTDPRDR